jgi:hypothetical protein
MDRNSVLSARHSEMNYTSRSGGLPVGERVFFLPELTFRPPN